MENEKRLIDAIKLAEKINEIHYYVYGMRNGKKILKEFAEKFQTDVLLTICEAPTVDAVEVVRCKDCKYEEDCIHRIKFLNINSKPELCTAEYHPLEYCSYGERRTNV